ncbi:MAG: aminotransferase class V-fold PLP-dependent enzyme [Clostridiales bacterium]|nr:aminotransferase class V-fold PLP-dependent enzyme [Clostridiales bacterium]
MNPVLRKVLASALVTCVSLSALTACSANTEPTTEATTEATTTAATEATTEATETTEATDKAADVKYTIDNIRDYVVGVDDEVELEDGSKKVMVNFDNAATTPALQPVMDAVNTKLAMYGSIGRGYSVKSNYSTALYEETRTKVLEFFNAEYPEYECIYVNTTTDGLNKLASALVESPDDVVLATRMEHHANDLPWRERCKVIYAEVDDQGRVIYDELEKKLNENKNIKYVTVTAASNVTGYVTDVHRVAKMAHEHGAKIIVDGAQIVAHRSFSMKGATPEENIDFLVFSAHKMYSPYGGGAIVGLREVLDQHMPEFYGGGIVDIVSDNQVSYKEYAPDAYEAGSPNYPGVVGLGATMDVLKEVGFDNIQSHEQALVKRMMDGLKKLDNVIIYGDSENLDDRVGVITFNFSDINSGLLANVLSERGMGTRRGAFCAHPYVWRLMGIPDEETQGFAGCEGVKTPGMIRVSFGIYNTEAEVDEFLKTLEDSLEYFRSGEYTNPMMEDIPPAY